MSERVAVFLDYQNVHLVAAELFAPYGKPAHETILHPLRVAERVVGKRRGDNELVAVRVYRGRPNPGRQATNAAASDAQAAAWERDRRVKVIRRNLKYSTIRFHDLRPSFTALKLAQNYRLDQIKNWMGHHSIKITVDLYGTWVPDDATARQAADDAAYRAATPTAPVRQLRPATG